MRLWLVDDNATFRDLLAALLTREGGVECAGQFSSADAALSALTNESPPDAILLDIQMGGQSGLDAIRPIKALAGSVHVFMLTTFYDHDRKVCALERGASGFLLKSYAAGEILRQLREAREQPAPVGIRSTTARASRDKSFGPVDPASCRWPEQRANGRADNAGVITLHSEHARRDAPWRCASSRLLRSVRHLRTWLGIF
jgi:DNA-binding NarL/FixJ family response regulator